MGFFFHFFTLWKYFSVTRILREINSGEFRVSKNASCSFGKIQYFQSCQNCSFKDSKFTIHNWFHVKSWILASRNCHFHSSKLAKLVEVNILTEPLHFAKLVNWKIFKGLFTFRALYLIFLFRTFQKRWWKWW